MKLKVRKLLRQCFLVGFLSIIFSISVVSCKKVDEPASEAKALREKLFLEKDLHYIKSGSCLVEFKENFSSSRIEQSLGTADDPACIPGEVKEIAFRARIDIDEKLDPGKLALAIVIDSSGSLRSTDPLRQKNNALLSFLRRMGEAYKDKLENLKIKLIFTGYCELLTYARQFDGSSMDDYTRFIGSVTFPYEKHQTNFINALQSSKSFLDNYADQGFDKNIILFSDGMPWAKASYTADKCPGVITSLDNKLKSNLKINLEFDLAGCSNIYLGNVNNPECAEKISQNGLSNLGLLPELDPLNFLVAMQQHINFAKTYLIGENISFHSVFLKSGTCWEEKNSSGKIRQDFNYLCNEVARNQLFQMMSGGSGENILIENADLLNSAFSRLYTGLMKQYALEKIQIISNRGEAEGVVCSQAQSRINCPLGEKRTTATSLPSKSEEGNYNVHFYSRAYDNNDNASLVAKLIDRDAITKFNIPIFVSSLAKSCSRFQPVTSYIKDGFRHKVESYTDNSLRISCKSSQFLGCVDESGVTVGDGETVGVLKCNNYPSCGQVKEISQTCRAGKLVPQILACPDGTKTIEECKPTICSPGEVVGISGKEGQIHTIPNRANPTACANKFECTTDGWKSLKNGNQDCNYACPANETVKTPGFDNERRAGSGFTKRFSQNCQREKITTDFVCKNSSWIRVDGEGIIYEKCKETRADCSDPESCGGTEYESDGLKSDSGNSKTSTIFGKRL